MMPKLNIPPPMDPLSERMIPSLNNFPSNNLQEPHYKCFTKNNAVTGWNCAVGAREWVGLMPKSAISSKCLQNYLSQERETLPLKNSWWRWCSEPSLQHPTTQDYFSTKIILSWWRMLGLKPRCEENQCNPSRGLSRKRGNPKQESLVLSSTF